MDFRKSCFDTSRSQENACSHRQVTDKVNEAAAWIARATKIGQIRPRAYAAELALARLQECDQSTSDRWVEGAEDAGDIGAQELVALGEKLSWLSMPTGADAA